AVRLKCLQEAREALGQVEQMYVKDVNRPVWPKQETVAQGQVGQRDAWDADSRRSRKPIRSRHVSP
ncbi:hypothetical protein KI387_018363, partial [Taxus chinensis]